LIFSVKPRNKKYQGRNEYQNDKAKNKYLFSIREFIEVKTHLYLFLLE
jgi:hypothetical protein